MRSRTAFAVVMLFFLVARVAHGSAYIVDDTGDDSDANPGDDVCATAGSTCTLRAAIEEANANLGTDTVDATAVTGAIMLGASIAITERLTMHGPATLSGTVVGGGITSAWPLTIDGGGVARDGFVISTTADGTEVIGFAFTGIAAHYDDGAILVQASGCKVQGDMFFGNGRPIFVTGDRNQIGGTGDGDGNLLLDNSDVAISITGRGNIVEGNIAGTNAAGTEAHPNHNGVSIEADGDDNMIGGATSASRNLLSGNEAFGIHVDGPRSGGTIIRNNFIGVAIDGVTALCNTLGAIEDEGTASAISDNVQACQFTGCCKYHGTSLNYPGLSCIDATIAKAQIVDCTAQLDPTVGDDRAEYTNPQADCDPKGYFRGACPDPADTIETRTPDPAPTATPSATMATPAPTPFCAARRWLRLHPRNIMKVTQTLTDVAEVTLLNPPLSGSLYIRSISVSSAAPTVITLKSGSLPLFRLEVPGGRTWKTGFHRLALCLPPASGLSVQQTGSAAAGVTVGYARH